MINPGQKAAMSGQMLIEELDSDTETLELLTSWGLRDCKSLGKLDELSLVERIGEKGIRLRRLARGEIQRELAPITPLERFLASVELEQPLDVLEPLAFILNRLLTQLMGRLATRSLATDQLQVEFTLAPELDRVLATDSLVGTQLSVYRRALSLAVPTQDAKILLKLLQLDLAAHRPAAPITKIEIEAFPAKIRVALGNLFRRHACDPAKIDLTLAKLRAVVGQKKECGRGHVGFARICDSYNPDDCEMLRLQDLNIRVTRRYYFRPAIRLRRFRAPRPASVEIENEAPSVVRVHRVGRPVISISGPWRLGTDWWNKAAECNRNEWNVELSSPKGRAVYRIFENQFSRKWFVEGIYD